MGCRAAGGPLTSSNMGPILGNTKFINWQDHSDKALRVAGS